MNKIVDNILNEIECTKKTMFTKVEIVDLIKKEKINDRLPIIESNGVNVNPETMLITYDGKKYSLPKKEFELLHYLITNKSRVLTRDQILRGVWGSDICVDDKTVNVHIHKIRSIIPKEFIYTNKGIGYRWIEKFQ